MNITLRKASALQNAIQEAIRNIEVKVNVSLNEFQDPQAMLDAANAKLIESDQRRNSLLKALYDIRAKVGQANATAGINDRLATAAYIDKRIGQIAAFFAADAVQDAMEVIVGKVDKLKNDKGESRRSLYGYGDSVTTGVLAPEQVAKFQTEQRELKKQKQKLNDEILELNVRTEISIADTVAELLAKEGLL